MVSDGVVEKEIVSMVALYIIDRVLAECFLDERGFYLEADDIENQINLLRAEYA